MIRRQKQRARETNMNMLTVQKGVVDTHKTSNLYEKNVAVNAYCLPGASSFSIMHYCAFI